MERFSALILSHDLDALRVMNRAFEEYGLEANVVRNVRDANELLKDRRFDLAVCDYDLPEAQQLAYLEPGSAWRGMIFALIRRNQLGEVQGQRVHLTLPKPLTPGLFSRGLKAAYTTMAHERRAALRYPVEVDASWAELIDHGEHMTLGWARILNLSHTGMCLQTRELLPQHAIASVTFELPKNGGLISVEGEVVWAKAPGKAGIRFNHLPAVSQKRLTEWLEAGEG
jgi:hypothetical protein